MCGTNITNPNPKAKAIRPDQPMVRVSPCVSYAVRFNHIPEYVVNSLLILQTQLQNGFIGDTRENARTTSFFLTSHFDRFLSYLARS